MGSRFPAILVCVACFYGMLTQQTYAQEESLRLLRNQIGHEAPTLRNAPDFKKAYSFFKQKENDSTILYAYRCLAKRGASQRSMDYAHYFRAEALANKKLHGPTVYELRQISVEFPLYYLVRLRLGEQLLATNELEKSLGYLKQSEKYLLEMESGLKISRLYHNMGICYLHLAKLDSSEIYLQKSLSIQKKEGDTLNLIGTMMDLANLYYEQFRDEEAITLFQESYALAMTSGGFDLKENAAFNMAIVEENRNHPEKALAFRKEYEQWHDSILDQSRIWEVGEKEKQFAAMESRQREQVLRKENQLNAAQRNLWIAVAAGLSGLAVLLFVLYLVKRKGNRIILEQKRYLSTANATKNRLFSVVSHDLRYALNTMERNHEVMSKELIASGNVSDTLSRNAELTSSTRMLLNNILNWALLQEDQLYFHPDPLNVRSVVQQVAFSYDGMFKDKSVAFSMDIGQEIAVYADVESVKMILRNLFDNALKHLKGGGAITVTAEKRETFVRIGIHDTGAGMEEEVLNRLNAPFEASIPDAPKGFGWTLCKTLVVKNNGRMYAESQLTQGTHVFIELPIFNSDETT